MICTAMTHNYGDQIFKKENKYTDNVINGYMCKKYYTIIIKQPLFIMKYNKLPWLPV